MPRPVTLALLWHQMNSDNLGVGALTLANLAILRDAAADADRDIQFIISGWRDPRPWYEDPDDVENLSFRTRHLVSPKGPFAEALAKADAVFDIGGGDSFTDIYGPKRFFTIWSTKMRAVLRGKPLILSPQTIGPFSTAWARPLARAALNRATAVVTRDATSTAFVKELGISSEVLEATDVAMYLPYDTPAPRPSEAPIRVGLNVSGLLMNGGYSQSNQFGLTVDYPALIREILRVFGSLKETEIHLIGHVQSENQPIEDDQRAGAALAQEFPDTVLAPVFHSPQEVKSYIAGMDFFMGARMHATIAAFSTGVPVIPMAYSRKFRGVFETLGYYRVVDMKAEDATSIITNIRNGFHDRETLQAEIRTARAGVDARLGAYRALAADVISKLPTT